MIFFFLLYILFLLVFLIYAVFTFCIRIFIIFLRFISFNFRCCKIYDHILYFMSKYNLHHEVHLRRHGPVWHTGTSKKSIAIIMFSGHITCMFIKDAYRHFSVCKMSDTKQWQPSKVLYNCTSCHHHSSLHYSLQSLKHKFPKLRAMPATNCMIILSG